VKVEPLGLEYVSAVISRVGKAAGVKVKTDGNGRVKFASAHDLRRSFGERWARRVLPVVLQELMRHDSIETTMTYYVGQNAERTEDAVWEAFESVSTGTSVGTNQFGHQMQNGHDDLSPVAVDVVGELAP
jgi:hypothetical protein